MIAGNLPVIPTRSALSVSNRPAAASTLPRGGEQPRFFSKSRPAAAPQSFDRQVSRMQQSIQRNGAGQSFSRGESAVQNRPQVQTQGPGRGTMSTPNSGVARTSTSEGAGWRRFSDSSRAQHDGATSHSAGPAGTFNNNVPRPGSSSRPDASTNNGSWRHFTPQSGGGPADRVNSNGGGMYAGRGAGPEFQRNEMSRPDREVGGGRSMVQDSPRSYSRPPLEMRQPIVTPRGSEGRGSAPRESAPSRSGGGGGGGGGGSHGGSSGGPHGGSGRH
jgi:hypothetical protein